MGLAGVQPGRAPDPTTERTHRTKPEASLAFAHIGISFAGPAVGGSARALDWRTMEQHLPQIYLAFRDAHPEVAKALDELGRSTEHAGPLDDRTQRLVKVALAVGSLAEGAVRANARRRSPQATRPPRSDTWPSSRSRPAASRPPSPGSAGSTRFLEPCPPRLRKSTTSDGDEPPIVRRR
jgi:hypothetical protein